MRALVRKQVNHLRQSRVIEGDTFPPGWQPATDAQRNALASAADILLFGGSAGSLKTETLLVDAARECRNPNLRAIVFRQSFPEMTDIIEKTQRLYPLLGGTFVGQPFWTWTFPSGAKVRLAYISRDEDVMNYLGPRYSFIGFDESTFHTEYQVRNMLGRLASTDRSLRLRMRLASNPGNIGAAWHKPLFLRGECPIHAPDKSAIPGQLYFDAKWPSDSYPLCDENGNGFSVCFIPGRLSDHKLLDDKYVFRLRMMSGSLAPAMEKGCWCALVGAYFANWDKAKMVVPYASIGEQWWDNHFLSIDYGFGKSSASAHLHVVTQDKKLRTIGEFVAANLPVNAFADEVVQRLVLPPLQGQRRRIVAAYVDPANFNPNYDSRLQMAAHSVAEQLNDVLTPYDLGCTEAANDRIGGWQLMYTMLGNGKWQIADTCPRAVEAIPSRMHDPKKPGDVLKVPGDPLDDVADDLRYGVYTWINSAAKPTEIAIRERLQGQNLDLTSASIRAQQYQDELEVSSHQPMRMGSRLRRR